MGSVNGQNAFLNSDVEIVGSQVTNIPHVKMMEAMWKVDPNGDFSFSDATDPNELLLFTTPTCLPLRDALVNKCAGKAQRTIGEVLKYVARVHQMAHERGAPGTRRKERVVIPEYKQDGKKRRKTLTPTTRTSHSCKEGRAKELRRQG